MLDCNGWFGIDTLELIIDTLLTCSWINGVILCLDKQPDIARDQLMPLL